MNVYIFDIIITILFIIFTAPSKNLKIKNYGILIICFILVRHFDHAPWEIHKLANLRTRYRLKDRRNDRGMEIMS
jgi:hypothetical protein